MSNSDLPYTFNLPITEDAIKIMMVHILGAFNIEVDEDKALKLFYSFFSHVIYHLYANPGFYFKLRYIDITKDDDNFLCVKKSSEYTKDTMNPAIFFSKFSGPAFIKEELSNTIDLFAESLLNLNVRKKKQKLIVEDLIKIQKELDEEIALIESTLKKSNKRREQKLKEKRALKKQLEIISYQFAQRARENLKDYDNIMKNMPIKDAKLKKELQEAWDKGETLEKIIGKNFNL